MRIVLKAIVFGFIVLLVFFVACKSTNESKSTEVRFQKKQWKLYEKEKRKKRRMAKKAYENHFKHQAKPMRKILKRDRRKVRREKRRNRRKYH